MRKWLPTLPRLRPTASTFATCYRAFLGLMGSEDVMEEGTTRRSHEHQCCWICWSRRIAPPLAPGTAYRYSDGNFFRCLSLIVGRTLGQRFRGLLAPAVFRPLRMDNTWPSRKEYRPSRPCLRLQPREQCLDAHRSKFDECRAGRRRNSSSIESGEVGCRAV